jgi:predicted AAA+ superfamily ATPase
VERFILDELHDWKVSKYRKPLILEGVRQVGKTWALKEFGAREYANVAYFNFDENEEYREFFETTKQVKRIIENLSFATGQPIKPHETLIIFDEVQDCPHVINSLKYFFETANEYHVIAAGSLLGIALSKPSSFPVGMVDLLQLHPMTFTEFLLACGDDQLVSYIASLNRIEALPEAFVNPLTEKLKMYFVTGGMPESVQMWAHEGDTGKVQYVLANILGMYERDFMKYPTVSEAAKISLVWDSLPAQLARENKKFLYRLVKEGARAREYEDALQWLVDSRLISKIYRSEKPGLPISAYDDFSAFKLYLVDVGLLRRHAHLAPSALAEGSRLFTEFKGALTENYILQAVRKQFEVTPRYWAMDKPRYEVDFLIQRENDILPVEVKSGSNVRSTSLKRYSEKFPDETKLRVRFSTENLCLDGNLLNIPLYLADYTDKLIELSL